jgi:putative SOS response-associated peptidase YedK
MCGRYQLAQTHPDAIGVRFGFDERGIDPDALGRLNISPTEAVLTVTQDGPKIMRWGLVPYWAKALRAGPEPINARSETCADKAPFKGLIGRGRRRCLIVADGWYEWLKPEHPKGEKTPFLYRVDGGELFALAGLFDKATIDGQPVVSATILTTRANSVCAPVHDRMPCVLADREAEAAWLSDAVDAAAACELLAPLDSARVQASPADRAIFKRSGESALSLF